MRVDLGSGKIIREKTDPNLMLEVIGGRGLNSRRLFDELKRDIDPLSEENLLLIGVGPVTGSLFSTSAYFTISGKSPLTGILGDSAAGGFFGPEMKYAGYDQLILTGKAEPCNVYNYERQSCTVCDWSDDYAGYTTCPECEVSE